MSQGNPSCLRFSLEESVWFQKGQEVSELISISLDPNITIQESDQYVTIQGALELAGEYKRSDAEAAGDEEVFAGAKFVQAVEEREEGTCEFKHYFPVDITIPNNRIQSIYDIDVAVESFDYVLPERSCMKLTANLTITGLYGDQQHIPVQEWQEEVEVEQLEPLQRSTAAVDENEEAVDQEEYSVYQEKEQQEEEITEPVYDFAVEENREEEHQEEQAEPEEVYVPFEAEARKQPETEVKQPEAPAATEEKLEEKEEQPAESTPEISFASQRSEEAPPSAQEIYQMTEALESDSPSYEKKPEEMAVQESPEEVEESSSSEQEAKKKKFSKKKSMSLTEFFARKEEEEEHVKLKVCIVQNGDTIDAIAERYDIPAQQLLRVNHLEINQDIYEGQVLYIPVAVAH
ncbi:stage VI sporulation protein D [Cytobacillus oceanisediminis]|uniref:stage VI sporulation protein D n=1 Tax=Cytobacillus oceanisediminis TaxID=665099 RepID=UPI0037366B61